MTTIAERFGVGKPTVKEYAKAIECVNPELVIGLELETEGAQFDGDYYRTYLKPFNVMVESDNSLRNGNGGLAYEFITFPMRSDQALGALTDFFSFTKFNEGNYSDRCSVHVHVNCTDLDSEQISAVSLLYTTVEEIMFEFVGGDRDSNIYCIPWSQCRWHYNLIQNFLADSSSVLKKWNKYTALNLLPLSTKGTIEFRQMHGTADMVKLTKWINLIGSLFKLGTTTALKDLMAEIKELNSTSQYESFFNKLVSGQIPYNETYREKLEAGIILAKYSMLGMEKKTPKAKAISKGKVSAAVIDEGAFVEVQAEAVAPIQDRIDAAMRGIRERNEDAAMRGIRERNERELNRMLGEVVNPFRVPPPRPAPRNARGRMDALAADHRARANFPVQDDEWNWGEVPAMRMGAALRNDEEAI